jgi:hypothetical protein
MSEYDGINSNARGEQYGGGGPGPGTPPAGGPPPQYAGGAPGPGGPPPHPGPPPAPGAPPEADRLAQLEKKAKLILILVIVAAALGAANLAFQFVSPFAIRGGARGDFPSGQTPPTTQDQQSGTAGQGQQDSAQ